ncbi:MAG: bifunctional rhamnulose-1-phosphate aldolase/short-chain dehydrogenase [Phycisphaerales bacterium]
MSNVRSGMTHVTFGWDDAAASKMDPVARLVYRSNLLGSDQRITNTGGGNTSAKIVEKDPLTAQPVEVLWVKGSGGDLRTSTRANFSSLELPKVRSLKQVYASSPVKGVKTEAEDRMVGLYNHCTFNLNPRASSIDTPLHAFVPYAHVDHMHPNAVISIAASKRAKELTSEVYGDEVVWTPWQRPGFELGLTLERICQDRGRRVRGAVMGQHGLINWADDDKACYERTLDLIEKASRYIESKDRGDATFGGARYGAITPERRREVLLEILPWLRGLVSGAGQAGGGKRMIATVHTSDALLRFVASVDAPRLAGLGTSCPDHFLRTKIKPLFVDWDPAAETIEALRARLVEGLGQYRKDYAAYYERCKRPDSPKMRDPNPTVVLIPGIGMIALGKDKSESRVTAEFYACAVEVMRGAEAIDEYIALPQQEAFDIEYWLLEEAKLQRMPAEKEFARCVCVVVGAGAGIGRSVAHRLAKEGAHVVCADVNKDAADATARELTSLYGVGIGVAGTGVSACGPAIAAGVDITSRASVRAMLDEAVMAYGGIDHVVVTAGVYVPPDARGNISDDKWKLTFDVNVMGAYLVADECAKVWRSQGLKGSLVLTTSVNAAVAKRGSLAYDTSKAAANHLARELAVELAPLVRVNAVAPATVVEGSTMFPRDRVIASLTKYSIPFAAEETTESLRAKLAQFYADRTLLKSPITPADQAEAACFLLSDKSAKTTGQVISVDGGLAEAFLR